MAQQWYYSDNNQQAGPVTESDLDQMVATGRLAPSTLVWSAGMAAWQPFSQVRTIPAAPVPAAPPVPPAPPAKPAMASQFEATQVQAAIDPATFQHLAQSAQSALNQVPAGAPAPGSLFSQSPSANAFGQQPFGSDPFNQPVSQQPFGGDPFGQPVGQAAAAIGSGFNQFGNAVAAAGGGERKFCSQCGTPHLVEEMVQFGDVLVCSNCKPTYAQRMQEGVVGDATRRYAGFWIRFAAVFIDGVILGFLGLILSIPVFILMAARQAELGALFSVILIPVRLLLQFGYEGYFLVRNGATPGKMACGLKVIRYDGGPIGWPLALGRYAGKILSGLILGIGYIMAAFDPEKASLHDKLCNTRVIHTR